VQKDGTSCEALKSQVSASEITGFANISEVAPTFSVLRENVLQPKAEHFNIAT
jgi:hypothetical protein